jgi:tetrathionate reductase subunit C
MHIVELLTPAYESAWLPWAVQYFFLAGIATGAALLAAACAWAPRASALARLLPAAVLVLAVSAVAAPVSLLADLHQPARFWHFYAHFTPWSWMSVGALLLPVFVGLSLAFVLAITAYTGAELMAVRSRPLWNTLWVPLNLALTGWLATLGCMLATARFLPARLRPDAGALQALRVLGLALALALCLLAMVAVWSVAGWLGQGRSFQAALQLWQQFPVWRLSMLGSAVAGAALLWALAQGGPRMACPRYTLALGLGLAAAAWAFRWGLFMGVQGVPKYGAGLYIYHMPLGGDGLLGMLGVAGLCIALVTLATWALELFPARSATARAL